MYKRTSLSRREFLKLAGVTAGGAIFIGNGCTQSVKPQFEAVQTDLQQPQSTVVPQKMITSTTAEENSPVQATVEPAYLAVSHGLDPVAITMVAIAALGGMEQFVKKGAEVVIKPNICTDYHPPEYASTTNPQVVGTLVTLCISAGAKRVRVMDFPFGGAPDSAYRISGIKKAVQEAGGEMVVMNPAKFISYDIPDGKDLQRCEFYQDALEADVFINVPIAKHHSLARLTLGGKNLMGIISNRGLIHQNLGQRIADLVSRVRPTLTVIDAVRILMANGPTGGNLDDVKQTNTIIASQDIVAADAYATTLFGLQGRDISYIKAAADMGLGTLDLTGIKMEEINL
jgi:uncharacterized protein (DUF362 family)